LQCLFFNFSCFITIAGGQFLVPDLLKGGFFIAFFYPHSIGLQALLLCTGFSFYNY
jgi:hypothetical protein